MSVGGVNEGNAAVAAASGNGAMLENAKYGREMTSSMLNLSTSDSQIMNLMNKAFNGDGNDADRQLFTMLLQKRTEKSSSISSLLKTIHEKVMAEIRKLEIRS